MDSPGSDDTIDPIEDPESISWGYPLARMRDDPLYVALSSALVAEGLHEDSVDDDASDTSSVVYDIDFEEHVDQLVSNDKSVLSSLSSQKTSHEGSSFTLLPLPTTSTQLLVYLALNQREARLDPWNPIPHIICAVDRSRKLDTIFLCLNHLIPLDVCEFQTVANLVDLFRQLLEGLTFLHEHGVVHGSISTSATQQQSKDRPTLGIMVDMSADPNALEAPEKFDRTKYPVKYYFVDLSSARHSYTHSPTSSPPLNTSTRPNSPTSPTSRAPYNEDLRSLGHLFCSLIPNLPESPLRTKLSSLMRSMVRGTLRTTDEARKLFEVLVASVEGPSLEQACVGKLKIYSVDTSRIHESGEPSSPGPLDKLRAQDSWDKPGSPRAKLKPRAPTLPFGFFEDTDKEKAAPSAKSAPVTPMRRKSAKWNEESLSIMSGLAGLSMTSTTIVTQEPAELLQNALPIRPELMRKKSKHAHHPSITEKDNQA